MRLDSDQLRTENERNYFSSTEFIILAENSVSNIYETM